MPLAEISQIMGNFGEFFGAVAVVATLVYLAVQVRHSRNMLDENRRIALAQTYQSRAALALEVSKASDPELLAKMSSDSPVAFLTGTMDVDQIDRLDAVDKVKLARLHNMLAISMDNVLHQARLELVDNEMAEGGKSLLPLLLPIWRRLGVVLLPEVRRACNEQGLPLET